MGQLIITEFITLGGVLKSPGGPDAGREAVDGGDHGAGRWRGGWGESARSGRRACSVCQGSRRQVPGRGAALPQPVPDSARTTELSGRLRIGSGADVAPLDAILGPRASLPARSRLAP